MSSRPAPRVPAGSDSLASLCDLYQREQHLQDEAERICWTLPSEGRDKEKERLRSCAVWSTQAQTARIVMTQPVASSFDIMITLGMAANYLDGIVGSLDGEMAEMGASVATAIENALNMLVQQGALRDAPASITEVLKQVCTLPKDLAA